MKTDGTKILVVDDEIGYRKVLNNALTERGFNVKTAASGEEAMEELRHCDLLLVIGSSLVVYPVAEMPLTALEHNARLILLNRLPTQYDGRADVVLQMSIEEAVQRLQESFSSRNL